MSSIERISKDELSHLVADLAGVFIQRWDCYPMQLTDGRYIRIKKPLTPSLLANHVTGKLTLGTYLLSSRSEARFIVLDADDKFDFELMTQVAGRLADEGVPSYLERSRRGGHLWFFFAQPILAKDARAFGKGIMATYQLESVELFPKQDRLTGGPGSLIRLPFGVHQRTSKRYFFINSDGRPLAPTIRRQIGILTNARPVSEMALEAYQSVSNARLESKMMVISSSNADVVSKRIKEAISVQEFVSGYVDLDSQGRGSCPFHDDQHPSFQVDLRRNFWYCYAGCGGGSIVDFWAKWRERHGEDPGFIPTIAELAEMLF